MASFGKTYRTLYANAADNRVHSFICADNQEIGMELSREFRGVPGILFLIISGWVLCTPIFDLGWHWRLFANLAPQQEVMNYEDHGTIGCADEGSASLA